MVSLNVYIDNHISNRIVNYHDQFLFEVVGRSVYITIPSVADVARYVVSRVPEIEKG